MTTITTLPTDKIRILKEIDVSFDFLDRPHYAKIFYTRQFTPSYKMNDGNKATRLFFGYAQEDFPHDEIDEFIFNAVREKFQKVSYHSSIVMFDCEIETLKKSLRIYKKDTFNIRINPFVSDINACIKRGKTQWISFSIDLEMYYYPCEEELFKWSGSIMNYDEDKEIEFQSFYDRIRHNIGTLSELLDLK